MIFNFCLCKCAKAFLYCYFIFVEFKFCLQNLSPGSISEACVYTSVFYSWHLCALASVIMLRPQVTGLTSPPLLLLPIYLDWSVLAKSLERDKRGVVLILSTLFFVGLMKMGKVNMRFWIEVLFQCPVSQRHSGVKWRDDDNLRNEGRGRALAGQLLDCVNVYTSCMGGCSLWDCFCHILSVSGLVVVSWPSFSH